MTVEFHLIQNYPPSNPNRDENGAPKDCEFGGHRRARISSQSLKRAARQQFASLLQEELSRNLGARTKRVIESIVNELEREAKVSTEIANELASLFIMWLCKTKKDNKWVRNQNLVDGEGKTSYLFFIALSEIRQVAKMLLEPRDKVNKQLKAASFEDLTKKAQSVIEARHEVEKAESDDEKEQTKDKLEQGFKKLDKIINPLAEKFKKENKGFVGAIDIALFGRMLADATDLNIDAASQVAHAISTNRLKADFDFYTAMDDFQPDTEPGAGMMGTIGFNASCYYRYALVDMDQLALNLTPPPRSKNVKKIPSRAAKEAALDGLEAFLRASIFSVPTGKIHSMAHQVQPQFIMTAVRNGRGTPCSLVNAFLKPARPRTTDQEVSLVDDSVAKLARHWKSHLKMFGALHKSAYFVAADDLDIIPALKVYNAETGFPDKYGLDSKDSVDELIQAVRSDLKDWLENSSDT